MYKIRYWLPFLAVWVVLCILLFLSIYDTAKTRTIDELNARQRIHAQQAAKGIEAFFAHWAALLHAISEKEDIRDFDMRGRETMKTVFDDNREEVTALTRVDALGTILYTVPEVAGVIGRNISDQKHIRRILATHEPVLSDVFHTIQGYDAIVLHTPVFLKGRFVGTIGALFDFKTLSKRYLETIRIGVSGYAWMLSAEGIELFCPVPGHVGHHVFENCKDFPTIIEMAKKMLAGKAGTTTYLYDHVRENQIETITKHAVYMPVRILDNFWSIAVVSSEAEILSGLERFKDKLFVVISLILFGTVVFTFLGLKASHVLREDEKRSLAEEALEKSEQRYRDIVEGTDNLVTEVDMEGRFTFVNEASRKVFGLEPEACIGCLAFDFVHPEDREKTRKRFEGWIAERQTRATFENRQVSQTGQILHMLWSIHFNFDAHQQIISIKSIARDITGRKEAEARLKRSEATLASIFKAAPVGIGVVVDRTITYANDRLIEMTGYPREDLLGKKARFLYVNEEEFERVGQEKYDQIQRFGTGTVETRWKCKDGLIIHALLSSTPIDAADLSSGVTFTALDITKRKRAEEALRESEEKFRLAFDASPDAVSISRLEDGLCVDINAGFTRVMGFAREEVIGKTSLELNIWHDPEDREKLTRGLLQNGYYDNLEAIFRHKNGSVRTALMSARIIALKNVPHIISITRDITDRIKAERALKRSEDYLFSVFRAVPTGIVILKDRVFTLVNDRITEITGYSREELLGRTTRILYPSDEDYESAGKKIYEHIYSRDFVSGEYRFRHKSGREIDVLITSAALRHSRESADTIHTILDITKRKKAEGELTRYREHLEDLVEERTHALSKTNEILKKEIAERERVEEELRDAADTQKVLVREVNHRVKNNLSAIIGMLHMEEDRIRREGHAQYTPMLEDLICRIEGLSTVHSLLSASGWRSLNIHELCRQAIDAALKGIPIGKEVDVKVGSGAIKISSNQAHHLTLVINELATNSMKYAFAGRDMIVIQVAIEQIGADLKIEFRDDGPGYPQPILLGDLMPTSIGFELIKGITRQSLDGTVVFTNDDGACATIVFRNELNRHPGGGEQS